MAKFQIYFYSLIICTVFIVAIAFIFLPAILSTVLAIVLTVLLFYAPKDRFDLIRRSRFKLVRKVYQTVFILYFAFKLERVCSMFPEPDGDLQTLEGGMQTLNTILAAGPNTYQKKHTNLLQIESLMECVSKLVPRVTRGGAKPLILDIGAGKALLSRAIYETFDRKVSVVALDNRPMSRKDEFYDPSSMNSSDAPYVRIVADVQELANKALFVLEQGEHQGGAIAITKHLCGSATDASVKSLCRSPLHDFVGACCLAPCCHQKIEKNQYCNVEFLQSHGFCSTHIGVRGGVQDNDFRTFGVLISISKMNVRDLGNFEFKNSQMLGLFGFLQCQELGRMVRRLLEEGRMEYLRRHGYECRLVKYCDEIVTNDNLAVIATRIQDTRKTLIT